MTPNVMLMLSQEDLERLIARAVEPLRFEIQQLRSDHSSDPAPVPEAARRLGVTTRSVQRWLKTGELKAVTIGGRRYVVLPDASQSR